MRRLLSLLLLAALLLVPAIQTLDQLPALRELPLPTPAPVNTILLHEGEEIRVTCGQPFEDPGWEAYGPAGEDWTEFVSVSGTVKFYFVGDYELQYLLLGEDGQELARATRLVHVEPARLPEVVHRDKTIYLTFDDGPCDNTARVLDILKKYDVKATFFVICSRTNNMDMLSRIVEEGHTLGIHCYEHLYEIIYKNPQAFMDDFWAAQEVIYAYTGQYAQVSRFPGGSLTAQPLSMWFPNGYDGLREMMHNMGIRYYDWDVQPEVGRSVEGVFSNFSNPSKPYDGNIVLQHDTRNYSVGALEQMIQWGLENGYTFAPIDLTTPEFHSR